MDDLVTVVVPVYCVEKYLAKCIESILKQTYINLEIILVDDGSPDNCGKICDMYAEKDKRIVVIHKENGGLSDARNVAIDIAKGTYITFVDSDDYIHEDYVFYLYELLYLNQASMSICEFDYSTEAGERINHPMANDKQWILDQKEALRYLLKQKPFSSSASGKLFKTADFFDVRFPKQLLYEDTATIYKLFMKASKVVFGARTLYYYVARNGSITKSVFAPRHMDDLYNAEKMVNDIVEKYPDLKHSGCCRLIDACAALLKRISKEAQPEEYEIVIKKVHEIRKIALFSKESTLKRRLIAILSYLNEDLFQRILRWI